MTVGSLFSGIGGFDLGFERAGFEIRWQVEIDPFCRAVLAKHWPDVRRYEDMRTVGSELARVDVLCGGFPCQDISVAGAGVGIDGERSGLWREFDRLIGELRPRYVVVKNVAALLSRGLGRVLGDLAARGFDAEWDCLPASAFGAPHQRDRVWIVAYASRELSHGSGRTRRRRAEPADSGATVAYADRPRLEGRLGEVMSERAGERAARTRGASVADAAGRVRQRCASRIFGHAPLGHQVGTSEQWLVEPDVGRVAHGVPARVDRLRGLGNAIVPQIAEWIARRISEVDAV